MTNTSENAQAMESNQSGMQPETGVEKENSWAGVCINTAISLALVIAVVAAYHFIFVLPNKQKFAFVDIAELLQLKELEVVAASAHPDASDAQRGEAFEAISKFAKDMEQAIAEIQQDCGCTLLVRAAVVKTVAADDLTQTLKQRMGMANLDQAKLIQQIRSAGGAGKTPILEGAK